MANTYQFPLANPLKIHWQGDKLSVDSGNVLYQNYNPTFNTKPIDSTFFINTINSFTEKKSYVQPYQQSDVIKVQMLSTDSTLGHFTVKLLNNNGAEYTAVSPTIAQESGTYNGFKLYSIRLKLYNIPEGKYFIRVHNNDGTRILPFITEPFHVKQIHRNTLQFEYYNTYNDQSMIYTSNTTKVQFRVHGMLTEMESFSDFHVYDDQTKNLEMVSGTPYRVFELFIGCGSNPVPEWIADRIERMFLMDVIKIDGKEYTRAEGSKLEAVKIEGTAFSYYKIKLRERYNLDVYELDTLNIVMGDMPQTNYFYVETLTMNNVSQTIQKMFFGKRNFLDYLNQVWYVDEGFWSEDQNYKLVFNPYDYDATVTAVPWEIPTNGILNYGMKVRVASAGDLYCVFTKGAIAGTVYTALIPNNGSGNNVRATYTGTVTLTHTFTAPNDYYIFWSDVATIAFTGSTCRLLSIGGDFSPSMKDFRCIVSACKLQYFENNMFVYTTTGTITVFNITNQGHGSYEIDALLRFIYDKLSKFNASAVVTLSGQSPSAPPSSTMGNIKALIAAGITTLATD